MDVSLESSKIWIMTSVVEARAPVVWLAYENRGEIFNLVDPGFTVSELVDSFVDLTRRGDLELVRNDGNLRSSGTTRQVVESLFEYRDGFGPYSGYFGLTVRGGRRWESLTNPRWENYVSRWTDADLSESGIETRDRGLALEVLQAWPYLTWGDLILPGTEQWRVERPWKPTYWKELELGYIVEFRTKRDTSKEFMYWVEAPRHVNELQDTMSNWYSRPWL